MGEGRDRSRAVFLVLLAAFVTSCATLGYPLKPETIRTGKQQPIRLGVAKFVDNRPEIEMDPIALERLVGEDAAYYTNYSALDIGSTVSGVVVKHLTFAGSFRDVAIVDLDSDKNRDYLELEIKALSQEYDAVLLGRISRLYGFDGYNAEGDHRFVHGKVHLVDLRMVRCRDLKLIWSGEAIANFEKIDYEEKGNQYAIANNLLREALNRMVQDLNRTRLPR